MKEKNMIISMIQKKAFDKIQHPFMVKTLNKFGTEGTFLKKIKLYRTSPDLILHMW